MKIVVVILVILLVLLALALFVMCRWFIQSQKDLFNSRTRYFELEQGMDEQQESFEAEYLSWADTKNSLLASNTGMRGDIQILTHIAEHHADNCIPEYAPVLTLDSYTTLEKYSDLPSKYYDRIQELTLE